MSKSLCVVVFLGVFFAWQCAAYECEDSNAEPGCGLNCNKQCSSIGEETVCPRIACPPQGCECKNGYYFSDKTNTCVTAEQCLNESFQQYTCEDPNSEPGCGYNCNKHCSSINKREICPRIACPANGCDCKDGYYFSHETNSCVTPQECPQDNED